MKPTKNFVKWSDYEFCCEALITIEDACETLLTHLDNLNKDQKFRLFKYFEESYWAYVAYKNAFELLHKDKCHE